MKYRIFYLPIETKARELLGKVLLAAKAVERGWIVIIGEMEEVQKTLFRHPPGAYVEISIPENKAERLNTYQASGHRTVNLCEENIVYIDGKDYCDRKMGTKALAAIDLSFTSGKRNDKDVRQHRPEGEHKFRMVGNPRFDTLLPELRMVYAPAAEAIRQRFGRFLLVNTNFAYVNNRLKPGFDYLSLLRRRGMIADEAHADFKRREITRKGAQFEEFKVMLAQVVRAGAFERVVLRPHPSENHDFWREWAKPHDVAVCYEGNANAWILAADAILHPGCTTGIESLLLDRPVATFVPDPGNEFLNQADEISMHVAGAQSFLEYTAQFQGIEKAGLREYLSAQRAITKNYIRNVEAPLSSDCIVDAIDELDLPELTLRQAGFGFGSGLREKTAHHYHRFDGAARALIKRRPLPKRGTQKYPGLSVRDIELPIRQWQQSGVLQSMPEIRQLRNGLYLMAGIH